MIDTKILFLQVLKKIKLDLVIDIGTCDGNMAKHFSRILPNTIISAIEANPILYKRISNDYLVIEKKINTYNCAISDINGDIDLYIPDVNYTQNFTSENNIGRSSILQEYTKTYNKINVKSYRLDSFIDKFYPKSNAIALWVDVESAEYQVITGSLGALNKVKIIHVETSSHELRKGQKTFNEVKELLCSYGFIYLGRNFSLKNQWGGDAIFICKDDYKNNYLHIFSLKTISFFYHFFSLSTIVKYLKIKHKTLFLKIYNLLLVQHK